ncbi:MAG TPA: hypothetical protein VKR80_08650 [Candidatus Limnocylindria bacterium]|nr:hypothetical protein [Candidatus Limnocylindria bacterium]
MGRLLVGIDDTDILGSRGTGFLARELGAALRESRGAQVAGITRHQLLVDPRIPYTSHNSAACLAVETSAAVEDIAAFAGAFLEGRTPTGADPGLCVVAEDDAGPFVAFGRRAQREVLAEREALTLATQGRAHLSAHGGSGLGVIGALAAVGLRRGGEDGRFLELGVIRELRGAVPAGDLRAAGVAAFVSDDRAIELADREPVDVGEWCRPVLRGGRPTLLIEEVVHGSAPGWRSISRERLRGL